jgi:hypothetical protein
MAMLAIFGLVYFALVLVSYVEIAVELDGGTMFVVVREVVGRPIRVRNYDLRKEDVAKVHELALWGVAETVRIEGKDGRVLALFPRFLDREEHDAMIEAVILWGGQSPSSLEAEAR